MGGGVGASVGRQGTNWGAGGAVGSAVVGMYKLSSFRPPFPQVPSGVSENAMPWSLLLWVWAWVK